MKLVQVLVCLVVVLIVEASKEKNHFLEETTFGSLSQETHQRLKWVANCGKMKNPQDSAGINQYSRRSSESTASSEEKFEETSEFSLKSYAEEVQEIFEWGEPGSEKYLNCVTNDIENFYKSSRLKPEEWRKRKLRLRAIEIAIINDVWHCFEKDIIAANRRMTSFFAEFQRPPFKIVTKFIPYGSFVCGLYDKKSDSDLSFYVDVENYFENLKIDKAKLGVEFFTLKGLLLDLQTSQNLLRILADPGSELLQVARKNAYAVKFITDSKTKLITLSNSECSFDISITKPGVANKMPSNNISRWINFYLSAYDTKDDCYRKFIVGIKKWARINNLIDPQKYMGAFGYYLLCLKFLKDINALPKAIPKDFSMFTGFSAFVSSLKGRRIVQKIHVDDYKITLEGNEVRRDSQVKLTRRTDWEGRDLESPGKLTKDFFDYYCSKFNNNGQVFVCLDPEEKLKFQSSIFHVCDPMDSANNVAKKMSTENFNKLKEKFKEEQIKFQNEKYSFFQ